MVSEQTTEMSRIDQLMQFLKEAPEDSFLRFAIAKEYEKSDHIEKALNTYLLLANDDPDYSIIIWVNYILGQVN